MTRPGKAYNINPDSIFELKVGRWRIAASETGELLPFLVSSFIPTSVLKAATLCIDPMYKWRVGEILIAPVSRRRTRKTEHILDRVRTVRVVRHVRTYNVIFAIGGSYWDGVSEHHEDYIASYPPAQEPLEDEMWDSTSRLRPMGSDYGELKSFRIKSIASPPRKISWTNETESTVPGFGGQNATRSREVVTAEVGPSAARLAKSDLTALRASAYDALLQEMQKNALKVLTDLLPTGRPYTFGRSLGELKDLPRSISSLRTTMGELKAIYDSIGKARETVFALGAATHAVPREYLSYHFAWKQMYQDIVKLLDAPERVTKRFNYLKDRAGRDSILRGGMKYDLPATSTPAFTYDAIPGYNATDLKLETVHTRRIELRGMASVWFDFPDVALPVLRRSMQRDMLGLVPRFIDVYKLTPWTWLLDWFTGLGNYLDAIETVNRDSSTINYGFLTGELTGEIRTIYVWNAEVAVNNIIRRGPTFEQTTRRRADQTHTSTCEYVARIRKGAHSFPLANVHIIGTRTNLSPWQQSILGAILATRK